MNIIARFFLILILLSVSCSGNERYNSIIEEITDQWMIPQSKPAKPLLILIGGYVGVGKSTLIKHIEEQMPLITISNDKIRKKLLNLGVPKGPEMAKIVEPMYMELFSKALQTGVSVALDSNAQSERLAKISDFLLKQQVNNYQVVKIYLKASRETLIARINSRAVDPEKYVGTVEDLESCLKKSQIIESDYDLVIDTDHIELETEFSFVDQFLIEHLILNRQEQHEEYAEITKKTFLSQNQLRELCSDALDNPLKNGHRYLPFNKNRVLIKSENDYINASYVNTDHFKFIASQGPTPSTITDHWNMLACHPISTIVILADDAEFSVYWPKVGESMQIDPGVIVRNVAEKVIFSMNGKPALIQRELALTTLSGNKTQTQFQFIQWPDGGVIDAEQMHMICEAALAASNDEMIAVHCRGGVGRTGTFIAALELNKKSREGLFYPGMVSKLVYQLRDQRIFSVHSEEQYVLLNDYYEFLLNTAQR